MLIFSPQTWPEDPVMVKRGGNLPTRAPSQSQPVSHVNPRSPREGPRLRPGQPLPLLLVAAAVRMLLHSSRRKEVMVETKGH